MRSFLCAVLLLAGCSAPVAAPSPSPSATANVTPTPTATPTPSPTPPPQPSPASGGIEVFAIGQLHGTYVWAVREEAAPQDRVTESLYAVPLDGAPVRLVVRRLRPRTGVALGYATTGIVPDRQITRDGTRLVLEQANLGVAAHDGLVVVDLVAGTIREVARGDQRNDVMPAWSPDGMRIAYMRAGTSARRP